MKFGSNAGPVLWTLAWIAPIFCSLVLWAGDAAAGLKTLYTFCSQSGCSDGIEPSDPLIEDSTGNLYGVVRGDGAHSGGLVFEMVFTGSRYKYRKLYDFCAQPNCADGNVPTGVLVRDANGNIYGTAASGGAFGQGVAYKLMPRRGGKEWKLKVLYDFCKKTNCADGSGPWNGLSYDGQQSGSLYDGLSPLYGVTEEGGNAQDAGTAFQLTFGASGRAKHSTIYQFCSVGSDCLDGSWPNSRLIPDGAGNLYGQVQSAAFSTTYNGMVFELSPTRKQRLKETPLYYFCSLSNCADGSQPQPSLIMDPSGNLVGATLQGGAHSQGVVFSITPNGAGSQEHVLYSFCAQTDCTDGERPNGDLAIATNGDVIGTTFDGGTDEFGGTLFRLHAGQESILQNFCSNGCIDGGQPWAGVVQDTSGNVFGTTSKGGAAGAEGGTVFEFQP
jgi:hypothetical protein